MTYHSNLNNRLPDLLSVLDENPLNALHRCRRNFQASDRSHNEILYELIAFVVAFGLRLRQSPAECARFLNEEMWADTPQKPKEKNLPRLATRAALGALQSSGARYQQALEYTKVVEHFLEQGIEPETIPHRLRRKPIYKILEELKPPQTEDNLADDAPTGHSSARPKTASAASMTRTGQRQDGCDWGDDDDRPRGAHENAADKATLRDENFAEDDEEGPARGTDNLSARSTGKHNKIAERQGRRNNNKRYPFNKDEELAVKAANFWECFFNEMLPNDEVPVMIRRLPDKDGWAKFEISSLLGPPDVRDTRHHQE